MSLSVQLQAVSGQAVYQTRSRTYTPVGGIITVSPPNASDISDLINQGCQPLGIGGFPKVVANYLGQTGSLSFDLLPNPAAGDYMLNDGLSVTTPDATTSIAYTVSYMDDAGDEVIGAAGAVSAISGTSSALGLYVSGGFQPGAPVLIPTGLTGVHSGTPIAISIVVIPSAVAAAQPSVGAYGGSGYAPGDTGTFTAGDGTATYTVLTVDGSGRVLTFTATGGTGYPDLGSCDSIVVTGAGDGLFRAILTASAGVVSSGITETYGGFGYAIGDTGTITTGNAAAAYQVLTVDPNGAVLTVEITSGGSGYTVSTGNATSVTTGSGDDVLLLDITAMSTSLVYSYHATLVRNQ